MQPEARDNSGDGLEPMWEAHREFLRRFLIGLARDIDLADDLLQESYLKARSGIDGYLGGDARAWLSAIAKSSFYSHLRRRYVHFEVPLGEEGCEVTGSMEDVLDLIEVRRAIADLPRDHRRALVMKHYAGYSYEDIALHMGCPVGTAKSRVSSALKRLREALTLAREETTEVKCADLSERMLMDYIHGRGSGPEHKRVKEHLAGCPACRDRAAEVGLVLRALDAVEADFKGTFIVEIHEDGTGSCYVFLSARNDSDEPIRELGSIECSPIDFAFVNGQEAKIESLPSEPGEWCNYKLHLAHPIAPRERVELLMIGPSAIEAGVKDLGGGLRRFDSLKLQLNKETAYFLAIRLPDGAAFERAEPDAQEVRGNGTKTVVWRGVLQQDAEQEFVVEFRV